METPFYVVLDTCVLVPAALCDTLLRLAEYRLYLPRWSGQTLIELERALVQKIGLTPQKAARRVNAIAEHFQDAAVDDADVLIPAMLNDPKDRHVAAAAVRVGAKVIVTLNLKDFPSAALAPFKMEARHPDRFLIELFDMRPEFVVHCLHEQAADIDRGLAALLNTLKRVVPDFVNVVNGHLEA